MRGLWGGLAALMLIWTAGAARAACPDTAAVARTAQAMLERRSPEAYPDLSLADAACAREKLVAVLAQPWGDPQGYKVGLTSEAAQRRFGVPHPLRGTLFFGTLRERSGAELPARFGAVPVIESDLLVRVSSEAINEAGSDHLAILRSLDQVIPFIELPDLVFGPGVTVDGPQLLAINVGTRSGVLGTPIPVRAEADFAQRLGSMTVTIRTEQKELARAPGTALLGHPLNVVTWLVEDLKKDGRRLRVGEYISLGSFSPLFPTEAGRDYTVTYEGLLDAPVDVSVKLR